VRCEGGSDPFEMKIPGLPIIFDEFATPSPAGVYLLSHAHTDHTNGLENGRFPEGTIYCTSVTRDIMLARNTKIPSHRVQSLPLSQRTFIANDGTLDIWVHAVNAHHCPGSAMFLVEHGPSTYLYTGDFRFDALCHEEGFGNCSMEYLEDWLSNSGRVIDLLVIDATFNDDAGFHTKFPSRIDCARQIVSLLKSRVPKQKTLAVQIMTTGCEYMLQEVCRQLNCPAWLCPQSAQVLVEEWGKEVPVMVTSKQETTSLHVYGKSASFYALALKNPDVVYVRASAMWAQHAEETNPLSAIAEAQKKPVLRTNGVWQVLHSMHSSIEELQTFVTRLRPKFVTAVRVGGVRMQTSQVGQLRKAFSALGDCEWLAGIDDFAAHMLPVMSCIENGRKKPDASDCSVRPSGQDVQEGRDESERAVARLLSSGLFGDDSENEQDDVQDSDMPAKRPRIN
jgi:DNA cross-link repair 1B protein